MRFLLPCLHRSLKSSSGKNNRFLGAMATNSGKKLIRIDISSDTVCPWCFVGKKNLDKAIAASTDRFDFEIRWHPFQLYPDAPKQGVNLLQFYRGRFGGGIDGMMARMSEIFRGLGMNYDVTGLTGSTMDSHRLMYLAGEQGLDKQHKLAEELFLGNFTQAKYIGDREFLLECAEKVGLEGAAEFLDDPNAGLKQVNEDLGKTVVRGVPYYVINGKHKLSGAQPPEGFLRAFEVIAKS
ncbi:unnamed protein product [Linum trigynum]|uniref:DSBA-like thioredoxin domain-containing protein n=1 Tax=Linum trigynum TaxID=586398 RepID=A0AAV2F264_9ROSI